MKIMFQIKKSFTSSSSLVPKKTSSAIEAGDSEEGQDAVPLGSWGWTLSWAVGDPQGWLHGLHSDAEKKNGSDICE